MMLTNDPQTPNVVSEMIDDGCMEDWGLRSGRNFGYAVLFSSVR